MYVKSLLLALCLSDGLVSCDGVPQYSISVTGNHLIGNLLKAVTCTVPYGCFKLLRLHYTHTRPPLKPPAPTPEKRKDVSCPPQHIRPTSMQIVPPSNSIPRLIAAPEKTKVREQIWFTGPSSLFSATRTQRVRSLVLRGGEHERLCWLTEGWSLRIWSVGGC
ncbi:hypothetical protein L873DRAFT_1231538 [Choiromyces venosus 120613-1]|uniref:Uncharacterized protein n=1 Tax=Choiromyces venosus 120613-1 TaxID=1336337 RepID=A0A3N4JRU8_9PEZI|nr:hypothetical protein L873DRAFT_1231538 [Choiromyces venosus 120613-1]